MRPPLRRQTDTAPTIGAKRALTHLFGEYDRARADRDTAEERLTRFAETIQTLIETLPAFEKEVFEARFDEVRFGTQLRGGEALNNVIALFKGNPNRPWTSPEVRTELEKRGGSLDSKAITNAINYLAKTGRLIRIARGQYVMAGIGIGIEIDGPERGTSRATEHDV